MILTVIFVLLLYMASEDDASKKIKKKKLVIASSMDFVIALVILATISAYVSIMQPFWTSEMVNVTKLSEPIEVSGLQRFIPLYTACVYVTDRIQLPTHRVYCEESYVYYANGSILYNWIIEPEGFWNEIYREPAGAVFVYGDRFPPKVVTVKHNLVWGLHKMRLTWLYVDTLWREVIAATGYDKIPIMEDNIEIIYKGEVLILIPLATNIRGACTAVAVPAGYAVVHEDGRIEYVSIEKALHDPRFKGVPIVPEVIARNWVVLYTHRVGFWDFYLTHNTIVIRNVGSNPQPYLLRDSKGNLYWVFIAEPPGETYSAKYIIYVNTSNFKPHVMIYELPEPMIGVSKVASYVKQYHPIFDWSQLRIEEPMPIVLHDRILWKATVVTKDCRGLVSVDIVDAKTTEVMSIQPRKQVTYLAVLDMLQRYLTGEATNATAVTKYLPATETPTTAQNTTNVPLLQRVQNLRKQVSEAIEALQRIQEELKQIEQTLNQGMNETSIR